MASLAAFAVVTASLTSFNAAPSVLYDDFKGYNKTLWEYADNSMGTTDGCKVWYLKVSGVADPWRTAPRWTDP